MKNSISDILNIVMHVLDSVIVASLLWTSIRAIKERDS